VYGELLISVENQQFATHPLFFQSMFGLAGGKRNPSLAGPFSYSSCYSNASDSPQTLFGRPAAAYHGAFPAEA